MQRSIIAQSIAAPYGALGEFPPCYIIALGSNRAYRGYVRPELVLRAALQFLAVEPWQWLGASNIRRTAPLGSGFGSGQRCYANALAMMCSDQAPPMLLERLQQIEVIFARRRRKPWGERTLDLDIILWSGGSWSDSRVTLPHPHFRKRSFILAPLAEIAPRWRDPISGYTAAQLLAHNKKSKAVDRQAVGL